MRPLNRIDPKLPAAAMRTYVLLAPVKTHWRQATCAEVGCPRHAHGWRTLADESTELGQKQAWYIRKRSGRRYAEGREGLITVFTFDPGQRCFRSDEHRVRLDREPLYVVRDGDWRGNPRRTDPRRFNRGVDWVDHFASHQDRLATRFNQG